MNKHDSEKIAGLLTSMGYENTNNPESSNIVVFNTCSVREHAAGRLYGNLNALKPLKKTNPDMIIAVGGCIAQNDRSYVTEKAPHVDIVFGTQNITEFPLLLNRLKGVRKPVISVTGTPEESLLDIESVRAEKERAWLPVITGCDNFCSYCIVPYTRGRERSIPLEDLIRKARQLIEDGVIEITLLGQNVNSYGNDIYGTPVFHVLLEKISKLPLERIRFTTSHPKDLTPETIKAIASSQNICKHIHLPVQSGSNKILKAMNRKYGREEYLKKIRTIREHLGDISVTTDIIVGCPGEDEKDFEDTLSLVQECQFDSAYTFLYSPRKGTRAYLCEDNVPVEIKSKRYQRLTELQNDIALARNTRYFGKILKVFVEGSSKKSGDILSGRTDDNKLVHFEGARNLIGKITTLKITEAKTWYLIGERCQ